MQNLDSVDTISLPQPPILTEISKNKIIIGDNLSALELLKPEYQNRVNLIYIDPPYSRNHNDVNHEDRFGSGTDWCNFLRPRLIASRDLLTEDGICLVSMDDSKIHYLRLLLDEVFGEKNFINTIVWY